MAGAGAPELMSGGDEFCAGALLLEEDTRGPIKLFELEVVGVVGAASRLSGVSS